MLRALFLVLAIFLVGCNPPPPSPSDFKFSYQSYEDPSFDYTIDSLDRIPFNPGQNLDLGYYRGAVWIKVQIENLDNQKNSFVIYTNDHLNRTYKFYNLNNVSQTPIERLQQSGFRDERSFNFPKPNFLVELNPGETSSYLIHLESDGRMVEANLSVVTLNEYMSLMQQDTLINFFFYGSAFIILMINLFYWTTLKKRIYLYYVLYIITSCLVYLALGGYLYFNKLEMHTLDNIIFLIIRVWLFSLFSFVFILFDIEKENPRYARFARGYSVLYFGGLTSYQFIFYKTSIPHLHILENIFAITLVIIIAIAIAFLSGKKRRETKYYILALITFVLFSIIAAIESHGDFIPGKAPSFLLIGSFLEFTIFTFTISSNIKKSMEEQAALNGAIIRLKKSTRFEEHDLTSMLELLKSNINNDKQWSMFKELYIELDPVFFSAIFQKYPNMTKTELRLITLIKIGFTQKEISTILNIASDSVRKAKQRLKGKWNLPKEISLGEYLEQLK